MGIDVPTFGRRVDRPADFGSERGSIITANDRLIVSGGSIAIDTQHINKSDRRQFLQVASITQDPNSNTDVKDNVRLVIRVRDDSGDVTLQIGDTGGSLLEVLPRFPIVPVGKVNVLINNQSSSGVDVIVSLSILTE
jgi:hypothetical protein